MLAGIRFFEAVPAFAELIGRGFAHQDRPGAVERVALSTDDVDGDGGGRGLEAGVRRRGQRYRQRRRV